MKECPEKEACLALKGKPIGMYHCPHCTEMIIAGIDPSDLCPLIDKNRENENAKNA